MIRLFWIATTYAVLGTLGIAAGTLISAMRASGLIAATRSYNWGAAVWRIVSRAVLAACRVTIEGQRIPAGGLIVANHRSWLDPFVLAQLGTCTFVAKSEIRRWPVTGLLMRVLPLVALSKMDAAQLTSMVSATAHYLRHGLSVVAFPEGTTSPPGALHEFSAAVFESAIVTSRPVVAVAIRYESIGESGFDVGWGDEPLWRNCLRLARQRGGIRSRVRTVLMLEQPLDAPRRVLAERCCSAIADDLEVPIRRQPRAFEALCSLIGSALRSKGTLSADTDLRALDWDSLGLVQLAFELEKQGITVHLDDLFSCRTIGELQARLSEHGLIAGRELTRLRA